jgi:hypothetical protein
VHDERYCAARLATLAAVILAVAVPGSARAQADAPDWDANVKRAIAYAETRAGVESFVVRDEHRGRHSYRGRRIVHSASVLKAMLLVAYLRRPSVRRRALTDDDRALLRPMIRRSDNATASRIVSLLGAGPLDDLAMRAGMDHFRLRSPWGHSEITARGQSRFFRRIDDLMPRRHREYGMRLLNRIVSSQRWGIPPVKPEGWRIYFKGGWGDGSGVVTHQVALLTRGERRVSLAILTTGNPSHDYGTATIRGIAKRLLRGLR